ncbi:MAG: pilus assembly protein [Pirellulaceae bacterium]
MNREVLLWCLPYLAMLVAAVGALRLLARISNVRTDWRRLLKLHADQRGGVQSLSFVLTLPIFVMIVLFIVQLSQLMIARAMVEYAAFAAARSASVWIPANLGPGSGEMENQISSLTFLREELGGDGQTYSVYAVAPGSPKFNKVHYAAAMACLPVCPSRDTGVAHTHPGNLGLPSVIRGYLATAPSAALNTRVPDRLANKLAYALANTYVRIEIWHKEEEPPLANWEVPPYLREFESNEIGWQDQIHVTVRHNFALLPGPGRLLARRTDLPSGSTPTADDGTNAATAEPQSVQYQIEGGQQGQAPTAAPPAQDTVADRIGRLGGTYVYTLSSTVRLSNEGEKPVLPYVQTLDGSPPADFPLDLEPPPQQPPQDQQPCEDCEPDQQASARPPANPLARVAGQSARPVSYTAQGA